MDIFCLVLGAVVGLLFGYVAGASDEGKPIRSDLPRNRRLIVVGCFTGRYGSHYVLLDQGEKSFRLYQLDNPLPDDALIVETDSSGKLTVTARTTDQPLPPPAHTDQRA